MSVRMATGVSGYKGWDLWISGFRVSGLSFWLRAEQAQE